MAKLFCTTLRFYCPISREILQENGFQISWNDFRNFLVKWEKNLLHLFLITFYRQSDRRFFFHLIGLNCTHRTAHSKLVDLEPLKKTHIGPKNQNTALLMWPNLTSINHRVHYLSIPQRSNHHKATTTLCYLWKKGWCWNCLFRCRIYH